MRRNLVLGTLALLVAVCVASNLMPSNTKAPDQQKPFQTPAGFEGRESQVRQVQAELVSALDELDLTDGKRQRMPSGKIIIVPKFGLSRVENKLIEHGPNVWIATPVLLRDPGLAVFANAGRPLTARDLGAPKAARAGSFDDVRKALADQVDKLNRGEEIGLQLKKLDVWAIPIRLTKQECLPCHDGMKVGDTVAVAAYFRDRT
jgi:hypothetical protein